MIAKKLEAIQEIDIDLLIQNSVAEGKTLEYKEALPDNSDSAKKEFLADVSSFANTSGGDLVFGIKEKKGIPIDSPGLEIADTDKELARIENLLITGLKPRIQHSLVYLQLKSGKFLIIIRVKQSWIKPHRVIFRGHDKFYGRNSIGKYPLDVEELRATFNLSEAVLTKINEFREGRILKIDSNDTWLPFYSGGKLVLHLVPFEAFTAKERLTTEELEKLTQVPSFQPMRSLDRSQAINFDGIIAYAHPNEGVIHSYVQVFRNGVIEAVEGTILNRVIGEKNERVIPSTDLERILIESASRYFNLLKVLGINPPIFLFLSLTGLEGSRLGTREDHLKLTNENRSIREDALDLPEAIIENLDQDIPTTLRPLIDLIWNAYGELRSPNFDQEGKWTGR